MNVQEMHIDVRQSIQGIATNFRRDFFPEELDWILNRQMMQYIGTHASAIRDNPGAADSLVHLSRLTTLLDGIRLEAFHDDKHTLRSVIPYKVAEMLSVQAQVQNLCGAAAGLTDRHRNSLLLLPVKRSASGSQWYKEVKVTIDGQEVFNIQKHAEARGVTFDGFQGADELWRLLNVMLPELAARFEVHWESYGNLYYPSTIIITGLHETVADILIDGTLTSGVIEYVLQTKYLATGEKYMPARLYFQSNMHQMMVGAFSRTDGRSPLCYLDKDAIVTKVSDSFIVGDIMLNYVRKPRRIDLSLNQNCELPESAHPDICNLAVEHIKILREDPNWEAKLKENMLRTTI